MVRLVCMHFSSADAIPLHLFGVFRWRSIERYIAMQLEPDVDFRINGYLHWWRRVWVAVDAKQGFLFGLFAERALGDQAIRKCPLGTVVSPWWKCFFFASSSVAEGPGNGVRHG